MRTIFKVLGISAFALIVLSPVCTWLGLKIPLLYGYRNSFYVMAFIVGAKWLMLRGHDVYRLFFK